MRGIAGAIFLFFCCCGCCGGGAAAGAEEQGVSGNGSGRQAEWEHREREWEKIVKLTPGCRDGLESVGQATIHLIRIWRRVWMESEI